VKTPKLSFLSSGYFPIISAFIILVFVKILLSFYFKTPWIFADETVYAETARNILHGEFYCKIPYFRGFPPGYSLFLSIVYLLFGNSASSYQYMLIINSFLSSSIIFPAYSLLKKCCSDKFSLMGSIFVALLPSVILYNFVVMSENLFIPLFAFSLWFLIESFETNSKKWGIFAGFSIFFLFFTRTTGIAMIIGFFFALGYYVFAQLKSKGPLILIKENIFSTLAFCIPTILWVYYRSKLEVPDYDAKPYSEIIFQSLSNIDSSTRFLLLIVHEVEFLILASYVILFIFALYSLHSIFIKNDFYNHSSLEVNQKTLAIKSGTIYFFVSSVLLVIITVAHMSLALSQNDLYYYIFGRYIDPVVPIISVFGLIGFHAILDKNSERKKSVIFLTLSTIPIIILFAIDFPSKNYKLPNMFTIFYIGEIVTFLPVIEYVIFLVMLLLMFFIIIVYHKKFWPVFLIFLMSISIIVIYPTLQIQITDSSSTNEINQIGGYLINNSNESSKILMTNDDYNDYWGTITFWVTQFYTKGLLVKNDICSITTTENCQQIQDSDYIISSRILPYHSIIASKSGYKLYIFEKTENRIINLPYTIDIGVNDDEKIENFYAADTNQTRWTKNYSKILIEYPKSFGELNVSINFGGIRPRDNPANITFLINDYVLGNFTYNGNQETTISLDIPVRYLNNYYNILEIDTNTWNPSDYESKDNRDLGILVDWISVKSNVFEKNENSCEKQSSQIWNNVPIWLCHGWYPLENLSGSPSHWMNSNASLVIYSPQNRTSTLNMQFSSFNRNRTLNISTEGQCDLQVSIPSGFETGFVEITAPVDLHQGENIIRFKVLEGCQKPSDIPALNYSDSRCLSLLMRNLTLS
jgi:4-amino-4-deoxy-L-arabinose transferase-like glycosyltransferase